ncbi:unnamed protein product [Caenorhabditis brenneri]
MDPANKVFNNSYLVERILHHALSDIAADFRFRLINQRFNYTFLVVLRKEYRSMSIEFGETAEKTCLFFFNGRELSSFKVAEFFRFLNKVANLKVESLSVRNINVRDEHAVNTWLHHAIHSLLIGKNWKSIRKLIGLETFCGGCEDCLSFRVQAEVYGPVGWNFLVTNDRAEHERSLIITSELLNEIASDCVWHSESRLECFHHLDFLIQGNLRCDTLILELCETQQRRGHREDLFEIPFEVLYTIIRRWRVKHLQIRLVYRGTYVFYCDDWKERYFTAFRFNGEEDFDVRVPPAKLDSIVVDLADSFYCRRDFSIHLQHGNRGYSNLLVNIQKIFSTNLISIKNFFETTTGLSRVHDTFRNIMRILSKTQRHPNLTVNFEFFLQIPDFFEFCWNTGQENVEYFDVPEEFYNSKSPSFVVYNRPQPWPIISPESVNEVKFVGREYTIEDNGVVFNLKMFLEANVIDQGRTINRNVEEFVNFFF